MAKKQTSGTSSSSQAGFVTRKSKGRHWVGNGFYVHSMLSPTDDILGRLSPLLLLDYAAPHEFPANPLRKGNSPRGVGPHPHRGFETVTLAYQGEVEHKDSSGGGGVILEGDVQWMTAGRGVIHSEYHSEQFSEKDGRFEMIQLWINLPRKSKMTDPRYQLLKNTNLPRISLRDLSTEQEVAQARLVAGRLGEAFGPAETHSPVNLYDIEASLAGTFQLPENPTFNRILFSLEGDLKINGAPLAAGELAILEEGADRATEVELPARARILVVEGQPIAEPIAWHGPFVMNTQEEIFQAFSDFESGKMG